jgi:hypothetical protein
VDQAKADPPSRSDRQGNRNVARRVSSDPRRQLKSFSQPGIKSFVDLSLILGPKDRESAHFGRGTHMGPPARRGIKPLDLHNPDPALGNRRLDLERPEQIAAIAEFFLREGVRF